MIYFKKVRAYIFHSYYMALHKNHIMVKLISWFNYIFTYCVEKSWFKVKTINNDKESLESRHKIIPKKLDLVWFSDSDTSTSYIIRYGFFLHTKFVQCFHASSYIMYYSLYMICPRRKVHFWLTRLFNLGWNYLTTFAFEMLSIKKFDDSYE